MNKSEDVAAATLDWVRALNVGADDEAATWEAFDLKTYKASPVTLRLALIVLAQRVAALEADPFGDLPVTTVIEADVH